MFSYIYFVLETSFDNVWLTSQFTTEYILIRSKFFANKIFDYRNKINDKKYFPQDACRTSVSLFCKEYPMGTQPLYVSNIFFSTKYTDSNSLFVQNPDFICPGCLTLSEFEDIYQSFYEDYQFQNDLVTAHRIDLGVLLNIMRSYAAHFLNVRLIYWFGR